MRAIYSSPWELELALLAALATERGQTVSVDVKHLHAVVVAVGDHHPVGGADGDVVGVR